MLGYLPRSLSRGAFVAWSALIVLVMGIISPMISPVVLSGLSALQCMGFGCTFKPTIEQEIAADRLAGSLRRGTLLIRGLSQTMVFNADHSFVGRLEKSALPLVELAAGISESHLPEETKDQLHSCTTLAHANLTSVQVRFTRVQATCSHAFVTFIAELDAIVKTQRSLSEQSSAKEWFEFKQQVSAAVYKLAASFGPLIHGAQDAYGACGDAKGGFTSLREELYEARRALKKTDYTRLASRVRCMIWPDCEHAKSDLASLDDGIALVQNIAVDLSASIKGMTAFVVFADQTKDELDEYQGGPELEVAFRLVKFHEFLDMLTVTRRTIEDNMETSTSA